MRDINRTVCCCNIDYVLHNLAEGRDVDTTREMDRFKTVSLIKIGFGSVVVI